jgi:micrococcal nuclease
MIVRRALSIALCLFAGCGEINGDDGDAGARFGQDAALPAKPDSGMPAKPDSGMASSGVLVDAVFDGDTLRVRANASVRAPDGRPLDDQSIRLLGVDAPEIAHPPEPADCWGDQSRAFLSDLVAGEFIELEYDSTHELRDRFDRVLAYVRLRDDRIANEVIIREGHGKSFRAFPHRDLDRYNGLEREARDRGLGLWTCP